MLRSGTYLVTSGNLVEEMTRVVFKVTSEILTIDDPLAVITLSFCLHDSDLNSALSPLIETCIELSFLFKVRSTLLYVSTREKVLLFKWPPLNSKSLILTFLIVFKMVSAKVYLASSRVARSRETVAPGL